MNEIIFHRGDVFWFEKTYVVEEPGNNTNDKLRLKAGSVVTPAIVVSNDEINAFSSKIDVVWLTRNEKRPLKGNVNINSLKEPSVAVCAYVHTIEKARATFCIGHLTAEEMDQVNEAIALSLELTTREFFAPPTPTPEPEPPDQAVCEDDATAQDLLDEINTLLEENAKLKAENAEIMKDKAIFRNVIIRGLHLEKDL